MKTCYAEQATILKWVQISIPHCNAFTPHAHAIAVIDDDNKLVAGVVYDDWRETDCTMSIASNSRRWCTRRILRQLFAYPFHQFSFRRVTAVSHEENETTHRFLERLGFKLEGRVREGFPDGGDALVYGMLKGECIWLENLNG